MIKLLHTHPGGPGGPGGPVGPGSPCRPSRPLSPGLPLEPVLPVAPLIPLTPFCPLLPGFPGDPVSPIDPGGPFCPRSPWVPGLPGIPFVSLVCEYVFLAASASSWAYAVVHLTIMYIYTLHLPLYICMSVAYMLMNYLCTDTVFLAIPVVQYVTFTKLRIRLSQRLSEGLNKLCMVKQTHC